MSLAASDRIAEIARNADIEETALRLGFRLKRRGHDLTGACVLGCADDDGFILTPGKRIFLCRPSGAAGDVVALVRHVRGCGFIDAIKWITGDVGRDEPSPTAPSAEVVKLQGQRERAEREKLARAEAAISDIIASATSIVGTHGEAYLAARGLKPPPGLLGDLRFVSNLPYWGFASDAKDARVEVLAMLPAMVALIRDASEAVVGIHQTYLDPVRPAKWKPTVAPKRNGIKKMRKLVASISGAMIRLGETTGTTLAIGEGIETTLSWFALGGGDDGTSLACAMMRENFKAIDLPDGVTRAILIGDGDDLATRATLTAAGDRLRARGVAVDVSTAPQGRDFNDVLMEPA